MKYLTFIIIIFCTSCINKNPKTDNNTSNLNSMFIGKKCLSINKVLSKPIQKQAIIIYLYHQYDCITCLEAGFEITKEIDAKFPYQKVYVISLGSNTSFEQSTFKYYNYIYQDSQDFIRKELKYIPTPVMLYIDTTKTIRKILQPKAYNSKEVKDFIKQITTK